MRLLLFDQLPGAKSSGPALAILMILCLFVGCGRSNVAIDETPSDDQAIEAVLALRWDTVTTAFQSLRRRHVSETQSLRVWHGDTIQGTRQTRSEYNDGVVAGTTTIDSSGSFASSWTERFVSQPPELSVPFDHWLVAEPPYESPRRRDHYRFQSLPDTMVGGQSVQRFMVTPRGDNGAIQSVLFLATKDSNQVVGLRERRAERAPFFRQESDLTVSLERTEKGWSPASVVLDVMIDAPARAPRRYEVTRVFQPGESTADTG